MDYEPMTRFDNAERVFHRIEPDQSDPTNPPKTEEEVLADLMRDERLAKTVACMERAEVVVAQPLTPPT